MPPCCTATAAKFEAQVFLFTPLPSSSRFYKVFLPCSQFPEQLGSYFLFSVLLPSLLLQAILVKLLISSYLTVQQPSMTVLRSTNYQLHQP